MNHVFVVHMNLTQVSNNDFQDAIKVVQRGLKGRCLMIADGFDDSLKKCKRNFQIIRA